MTADRRRHPRYRAEVPAQLVADGQTLEVDLREICRDAVLVEAERSFALGSSVLIRAELPDGRLEVPGRIIRAVASEDGRHQLAVLFADVMPAAATQIDVFLATFSQAGQA